MSFISNATSTLIAHATDVATLFKSPGTVRFFKQNADLFNQVPLHYIASMLDMTPETFSRIGKSKAL